MCVCVCVCVTAALHPGQGPPALRGKPPTSNIFCPLRAPSPFAPALLSRPPPCPEAGSSESLVLRPRPSLPSRPCSYPSRNFIWVMGWAGGGGPAEAFRVARDIAGCVCVCVRHRDGPLGHDLGQLLPRPLRPILVPALPGVCVRERERENERQMA